MTDPEIQNVFDRWAAQEMQPRGALVHREPMFTANSVPGPIDRPVPATLIRHWRSRRSIFGVRYRRRDYFPAFQFASGAPKPIVGRLLNLLHLVRREDNWFCLYWFVGANAWLEGDASPYVVMDTDEDAVTEAALHANDQISD
jgi:hypothetical protein